MKAAQAAGAEAPPGARSVKVVLVGDGGCGKTSLLMVFAEGAFPEVSASPLRAPRPRPCHARSAARSDSARAPRGAHLARQGVSQRSVGSKAVLALSSGARASVVSSVKWQEWHLPGRGHRDRLRQPRYRADPKRSLGDPAWLGGTEDTGARVRVMTLPLKAVCPWASPLPSLCLFS